AEGVSLLGGGGGVGRNRRTRHAWGVSGSGGFWPLTLRCSALRGFCRADQAQPSSAGGVGLWWVLADDASLFGPTGGVGRMRRSRHPPGGSGSGGFWPMTLRSSALRGFCRADQAKPSSAGGVGCWWGLADD